MTLIRCRRDIPATTILITNTPTRMEGSAKHDGTACRIAACYGASFIPTAGSCFSPTSLGDKTAAFEPIKLGARPCLRPRFYLRLRVLQQFLDTTKDSMTTLGKTVRVLAYVHL